VHDRLSDPAHSDTGRNSDDGLFGGATATNVRVGDPSFIGPVLAGVFVWAGLYLRDRRLSALIPVRR